MSVCTNAGRSSGVLAVKKISQEDDLLIAKAVKVQCFSSGKQTTGLVLV